MYASVITDVLPFSSEPIVFGHDHKVVLPTGSTSGPPVLHAMPDPETDVRGSHSETEPATDLDAAVSDLLSYCMALMDGSNPNFSLAAGSAPGFPTVCAGLRSGIDLDGISDMLVTLTASTTLKRVVADLNARAAVSVVRIGDTLVVYADNRAAENTLRAHASLIRAQALELSGIHHVGYDTSITKRRGGSRTPRSA